MDKYKEHIVFEMVCHGCNNRFTRFPPNISLSYNVEKDTGEGGVIEVVARVITLDTPLPASYLDCKEPTCPSPKNVSIIKIKIIKSRM